MTCSGLTKDFKRIQDLAVLGHIFTFAIESRVKRCQQSMLTMLIVGDFSWFLQVNLPQILSLMRLLISSFFVGKHHLVSTSFHGFEVQKQRVYIYIYTCNILYIQFILGDLSYPIPFADEHPSCSRCCWRNVWSRARNNGGPVEVGMGHREHQRFAEQMGGQN